jgi:hypothetical protein
LIDVDDLCRFEQNTIEPLEDWQEIVMIPLRSRVTEQASVIKKKLVRLERPPNSGRKRKKPHSALPRMLNARNRRRASRIRKRMRMGVPQSCLAEPSVQRNSV